MDSSPSSPTVDALRKTRRPLRAQLARKVRELETELAREEPDRTVVQVKLEIVQRHYDKVDTVDQEILLIVNQKGTEEEQEEELVTVTEYEEKYRTAKVRAENFLEDRSGPTRSSSPSSVNVNSTPDGEASHRKTYKLPKIEIRKFGGDLKEWLGFWSQFQKIHDDSKLHDSDKFQYLVQSMIPGTRAHRLVSSYPQSADNYPLVIAALKDRFGDKVLLTEVYVRQLLKLVIRNVGKPKTVTLSTMYDELESHLRALETLGVTQEQSAAFLYPLVESSLPEEIVRVWQRSAMSGYDDDQPDKPVDERLKSLMKFLRMEVKGAERLSYVSEGFGEPVRERAVKDKKVPSGHSSLPTAAGLLVGQRGTCIFCDKSHDSQICVSAQTMPYGLKKRKIMERKACLSCLKVGHMAKACKSYVQCLLCEKKHVSLMCPELNVNKKPVEQVKMNGSVEQTAVVQSQLNCTNDVLLQTLCCVIRNGNRQKSVRVLLDPGSQKSYILEKTARQLGMESKGEVKLCHLLFGGVKEVQPHSVYDIEVEGSYNKFRSHIQVLGHKQICHGIPRMSRGSWMKELKDKNIYVNDIGEDDSEIEVLIGSDYYAKWLTGRKHCLQNGLVALETSFGWTLSGKLEKQPDESCAMLVATMFVAEASVPELWNLEAIGIHDPVECKTREQRETSAKEHFYQTVKRSKEGRYIVALPWTVENPEIPDNREIAQRRLVSVTAKLQSRGQYQEYQKVFDDWLAEGIIETVKDDGEKRPCHYLPHRAVFKPDSQTTPVRPVFDASCKAGRSPSLNEMLEKGPNMLELLPTILLRFREDTIGITADIRKAFQMIEVEETDRDFLRFLWWENPDTKTVRVYRHKRVVFGVNCSPFLLAAVLELHLKSVGSEQAELADKLFKSLYVDNCATSVATYEEYDEFRRQATKIMSDAKMDLRGWECTQQTEDDIEQRNIVDSGQCDSMACSMEKAEPVSKMLGLSWSKVEDTLSCDLPVLEITDDVTKRVILSYLSKIFDPVGFICPALLPLKLLLQSAWLAKLGWDEQLPEEAVRKFRKWLSEMSCLKYVSISRDITGGLRHQGSQFGLHTFCDASQEAYATVVFLRTLDRAGQVSVQLLAARSRLAPLRRPTIPRMELLACVIGARLTSFVREALNLPIVHSYMWSDSTTALAWIKGNDEWGTFVGNRVKEICSLTEPKDWRHIPGASNPADLPSRGCSPAQLLESRWWQGPQWLYEQAENWPFEEVAEDKAAIFSERKGIGSRSLNTNSVNVNCLLKPADSNEHIASVALLVNRAAEVNSDTHPWYLTSSAYVKNIRVVAWVRRYVFNCRHSNSKRTGTLTVQEFLDAETEVIRNVQSEEFPNDSKLVRGLVVSKAADGLYHVKMKLTHRQDDESFRFPVLLPSSHPLVVLLIRWYHVKHCHGGTQFLMSKLRERFWILRARRAINRVIHKCPTCLRHSSRSFQVDPATLPNTRTESSYAFQTTGVDLAGPLYLKNGDRAWIVLFTCAVYRCVHLDFVTSLSTESFLSALERFINSRGRPSTVYSDNGSNFVGLVNLFNRVNWKTVEEAACVRRIKWIFNPPSAAWWGGWWERLIRTVKTLLKRMLGNARLNYDQLRTSLSHVENIINERPLTLVTEDPNDLIPLTPAMFLRGPSPGSFPESEMLAADLQGDYQKRQTLLQELTVRFRNEYLSQLVQRAKEKHHKRPQVGDVVLVGADDQRRLHWPMAKIIELIPGRDGAVRVARVKTQHGTLLRPLQRLYPLEVSSSEACSIMDKSEWRGASQQPVTEHWDTVTRSGRRVNRPKRLAEYC